MKNEAIESLKLIDAKLDALECDIATIPGKEALVIRSMLLSIRAAINGGGIDVLSAYINEASTINNKVTTYYFNP